MGPKYLVTILVLLALAAPAAPAHAGGIVSVCDEAHLRTALSGGGTVTFSCSGTITLTAEITIAADTTINGSGQTVTISGNNAVRVFTVNSGVALNLNEVTIANGSAGSGNGGGIANDGTLSVSNSTFSGNNANCDYCGGGGIGNAGMLTVSNSTFSGNSVGYYGVGGGIRNSSGVATVSNSTFSGNIGIESSGGIYNHDGATLTVDNSTFSGHTNGCIHNGGTLTVRNSTFFDNYYSGGITNAGALTLRTAPSPAIPTITMAAASLMTAR